MNEQEFEKALKNSFSASYKLDDILKSKTLDMAIENQKAKTRKREEILLIVMQIIMFISTVTIVFLGVVLNLENVIMAIFLGYILVCTIVSLGIVLNNKKLDVGVGEV